MAKAKTSSRWSTRLLMLIVAMSTGTIGGFLKTDLPILGPLVSTVTGWASGTKTDSQLGTEFAAAINRTHGGAYQTRTATPSGNYPTQPNAYAGGPGPAHNYRAQNYQRQNYQTQNYPAQSYQTQNYQSQNYSNRPANPNQATGQLASARQPSGRLLIATFNIQVFGQSKMSKPQVVDILAQTCRQFDMIAIQEIRAKSDDILPDFVRAINADGHRYSFLIGDRIGRTVSTEQYAYVFNTDRIEHDPYAFGTMADPSDKLHREPFVARFRARTSSPQQAFTFWLVNTHTDPDEVPEEVAALAEVFQVMQTARPDEDDVILLGDLNASDQQLGPLGQVPGITWVVRDGVMTNTRKTKAYDNILFHSQATREYTGRWGVVDLEQAFGLSREQALDVSDHLPVWAEFNVWEAPR